MQRLYRHDGTRHIWINVVLKYRGWVLVRTWLETEILAWEMFRRVHAGAWLLKNMLERWKGQWIEGGKRPLAEDAAQRGGRPLRQKISSV